MLNTVFYISELLFQRKTW